MDSIHSVGMADPQEISYLVYKELISPPIIPLLLEMTFTQFSFTACLALFIKPKRKTVY
jgi:hypothetical protein